MFLTFLVAFRNPVILLPPFYGTNLWVTYNNSNLPWYCSKAENDKLLWLSASYLLPYKINCMFKLMTTFVDENGNITDWPNSTVYIHDFGGDESVRYVVHAEMIHKQYGISFANFVDHFKNLGWKLKKDLFVAPYDWRLAPTYSEAFWPEFKKLIENAYENLHEKITIIGFSQGGFMAQQFFAKHCTTEWKEKYISKCILIAPSFTGNLQNMYNFWVKRIPFASYVHTDTLSYCFEQMPSVHVHMPNEIIYKDFVLAIGPDGKEYKGTDIYDLIMNQSLFNENARKMYEKSEEIMKEAPIEPGIKTILLMNSGIKTAVAMNFTNGFQQKPERIFGEGDGTLPAYGHRWACKNWQNVTCVDFKNTDKSYQHHPLISNERVLNIISNITVYDQIPELENGEEYVNGSDEL